MINKVVGYKSFSSDYLNQAGEKLNVGCKYHYEGKIRYNKSGYHLATHFEDTIPFSDILDKNGNRNLLHDICIAEVIGSGIIDEVPDTYANYYGYYDMYACSDIEVIRYIPREELIKMALKLNEYRMLRFVSQCKLTKEEIKLFENKYPKVDMALDYYQKNIKDVYSTEENRNKYYKMYFTK